jgi:intraflagellar transport protein 172
MAIEELISGGGVKIDEAVKLLQKRPAPASDTATNTYRRLTFAVLSRRLDEEGQEHYATVATLRDSLYRLANQYRVPKSGCGPKEVAEIESLLMATHYQHIFYSAKTMGLKDIAVKCAVTLLKYPEAIPQDKAFYQAGSTCKEQGNTNLAFMLLNR